LLPIHDWLFKGTLRELVRKSGGRSLGAPEMFPVATAPQCRI